MRTEQGKLYLFVAIDRTSKFVYVERHPWTNGLGRAHEPARSRKPPPKRYCYDTHEQLRAHLDDFVTAYNFARRLKMLKGLTPYQYICKAWTKRAAALHP